MCKWFITVANGLILTISLLALFSFFAVSAEAPAVRIVFSGQTKGGTWDLWLASSDGVYLQQAMVTPDTDEKTPVLSPNRKYVAYSTSGGELCLYNLYDKNTSKLSLPTAGRAAWPAWDPNAFAIYYVNILMGKGPDEGQVWRYDIKSGKAQKVADDPEVEGWPAVNHEGVLLFTTWAQSQVGHVSMMMAQDQKPRILWDQSLNLSGAAFLRDGRIAAIAGDGKVQRVILLKNDGKLDHEFNVSGASGRPVVYENELLLTRIEGGMAGIHVMDLTTGKTHPWMKAASKDLVQLRDPDYR